MAYLPRLVSERQPTGHWDRCLESSVSMLTDKMSRGGFVVDPRKLEIAIPDAANGTTIAENIAAMAAAYPTFPLSLIHSFRGNDTIEGLLESGRGLAVNGYYDELAKQPGDFTRWDVLFARSPRAGHATYIQQDGPGGQIRWSAKAKFVWWMDPLAVPGYLGEWMPIATLFAFLNANANAYGLEGSVVSAGPAQEDSLIYSIGGLKTAVFSGPYSHEPGGPTVGIIASPTRFLIAAYDATGRFVAINGLYSHAVGKTTIPMGWVSASAASAVQDALIATDCSGAIATATASLTAKIHAAQEALA